MQGHHFATGRLRRVFRLKKCQKSLRASSKPKCPDLVIFIYAELKYMIFAFDTKLLVYLVFNRKAVTIPTETPSHVMSSGTSKSRNHVFDSSRENVTIVRKASRKRRTIIKHIFRATLAPPQLFLERIGFLPVFQNGLFLHCIKV